MPPQSTKLEFPIVKPPSPSDPAPPQLRHQFRLRNRPQQALNEFTSDFLWASEQLKADCGRSKQACERLYLAHCSRRSWRTTFDWKDPGLPLDVEVGIPADDHPLSDRLETERL